jgi:hypothetical protein
MPSLQAYQFRMPAGFAGDLQRAEVATIETQQIDSATPPAVFGVPVKLRLGQGAADQQLGRYRSLRVGHQSARLSDPRQRHRPARHVDAADLGRDGHPEARLRDGLAWWRRCCDQRRHGLRARRWCCLLASRLVASKPLQTATNTDRPAVEHLLHRPRRRIRCRQKSQFNI